MYEYVCALRSYCCGGWGGRMRVEGEEWEER